MIRWIRKQLYKRGYRPKAGSIWYSPTLDWHYGILDTWQMPFSKMLFNAHQYGRTSVDVIDVASLHPQTYSLKHAMPQETVDRLMVRGPEITHEIFDETHGEATNWPPYDH